ncbi:hypothetical protein B7R54_15120 [Subtercola boreus]|uniref:Uncharacterized protein n=1 Tax=Subtercola boreus TaxID=120213 RepID=A0A3E0VNC4_9MICO|nr:hypothetical protein [Subtercola boreus]RFA10387.1 hypothetical protein B7R54_15120 [Subtercola boreus]TQL56095.1 hypothetical protein FB464_3677 [Subtercola boreus]
MTTEGPTTVATIQGILDMDRSRWIAAIAATREDAQSLEQIRPTVRVDANVSEALAAIESVRAAEAGLGGNSTGIAVGGSGPSAADVAATAAQTAAERRHTDAARDSAVAEVALDAAQEASTNSALEEAAAQETVARATNRANTAHATNGSRIGNIVLAVAALLPMAVPLAAGAISIAGALGMMGAAGVLAIAGIKAQMQQGTAAGAEYTTGLGRLKSMLSTLTATGAVAMIDNFRYSVEIANASMPTLTRETAIFAGLAGHAGNQLFQGVLTSIRIMEPLLVTAGQYVDALAVKFNLWTSDGGLEKFTGYALATLPTVERVLEAVSGAVLHILEALAPMGGVGLTVLTAVSNVISLIPVDVLGALITAIVWGTVAFKAWAFIVPMIEGIKLSLASLGTTAEVSLGPIGWIIAGVTALAAVFVSVAASQQQATEMQQGYTQAVTADTGVIGDNIRAHAAKQLQDAGAFDIAQKMGISLALVTDATLGNTAAQREFNDAINQQKAPLQAMIDNSDTLTGAQWAQYDAINSLSGSVYSNNGAIADSIKFYNQNQEAIGGATIATREQKSALEASAAAAGVSVAAYLSVLNGQTDMKLQTDKTTASMYLQNDAAGLLKQSLDLLNGKSISAAQAQNQFDSQIANMSTHVNAAGNEINRADTLIDGYTASAVKNRGELINLTSAAQANAQAFRDNGGSAEETKKKLEDMKQSIIDNAVAHGEDASQVQGFLDKIFQIPAEIPPTKLDVDTAAAQVKIDAFNAALAIAKANPVINVTMTTDQITNKVTKDQADFVPGNGSLLQKASGGTVGGSGSSSVDSQPHLLAPGEEVVSNQQGQASRYRSILKQINAGQAPTLPSMGAAGTLPGSSGMQAQASQAGAIDQSRVYNNTFNVTGVSDPHEAAVIARDMMNHEARMHSAN